MIKIGKYAFKDKSTSDAKITALGVDDEGNATYGHAIVKLGHIVLEQGEYDAEGNEIKAPVLSDKYHLDVAWKIQDTIDEEGNVTKAEHPYGWKSSAVAIADGNGVHSFYGVDYQKFKF